ncbi:hypothetical protein LCL85_00320 [Vibrio alginolyticus]|nr:hypothetical protein [Vibrio alginolyticus]
MGQKISLLTRIVKYILALALFSIASVFFKSTTSTILQQIIAVTALICYFSVIFYSAKTKSRSTLGWCMAGLFLTPFIGFVILLLNPNELSSSDDGVGMLNKPLTSEEQGKLLIFLLLIVPFVIFIFGIIPVILLSFGLYLMKKNEDFSYIDTAVKNSKGYSWLVFIGSAVMVCYWGLEGYYDEFHVSLVYLGISFGYLISVDALFYNPLKIHREWVEQRGIFSTHAKIGSTSMNQTEDTPIDENELDKYSHADELVKWVKLKEEGHLSEEEFNKVKHTILKLN